MAINRKNRLGSSCAFSATVPKWLGARTSNFCWADGAEVSSDCSIARALVGGQRSGLSRGHTRRWSASGGALQMRAETSDGSDNCRPADGRTKANFGPMIARPRGGCAGRAESEQKIKKFPANQFARSLRCMLEKSSAARSACDLHNQRWPALVLAPELFI